jgi:FAD/FMN-containing dehydrogenase
MSHPLAAVVTGPVLRPGDDGFADEVAPHNRAIENRPDVVVGATSAQDVVAAVRWATEQGVPLTVLATGHGATTPVTSGVLLTTHRLRGVTIDPVTRVATIGAGSVWTDVVPAADASGLTPVAGSSTNVGVIGYLLGGGVGPFARSHGYSSDRVESFTVVTGTGEVVKASADDHPDLFWALRGGRSGLGIVTQVRLRLVAMPELYAGALFFDAEHIETVLRGWLAQRMTSGAARSSQARRAASARTFTAWAHRCGLCAADVGAQLASPKAHRDLPSVLRADQAADLVVTTADPHAVRDRAVLDGEVRHRPAGSPVGEARRDHLGPWASEHLVGLDEAPADGP